LQKPSVSWLVQVLLSVTIHFRFRTNFWKTISKTRSIFRHRERHAKTLEIAQEEVLTCIGMCIYERLRKIHVYLREEENACQVLGAVAVHALSRNFDTAVEKKRGISNLELLYEEISREEKLKEQKKEQKKMKKRKKKERKNLVSSTTTSSSCPLSAACESVTVPQKCVCSSLEHDDEDGNSDDDSAEEYQIVLCDGMVVDGTGPLLKPGESIKCNNPVVIDSMDSSSSSSSNGTKDDTACHSCDNKSYSKSSDNSYGSEQQQHEHQEKRHRHHEGSCSSMLSSAGNSRTSSLASSSPEGSEIACSDGFCNHDQSHSNNNNNNTLSNNKNFQSTHAKVNGVGTNGCCRSDSTVDSGDRCGFTLSLEQMLVCTLNKFRLFKTLLTLSLHILQNFQTS
jgi:hypothetical protein